MSKYHQQLAFDHLRHEDVRFQADLDADTYLAMALCLGFGLDHSSGEQIVAIVDESRYAQFGADVVGRVHRATQAQVFDGLVLTDRRLLGTDPISSIPYSAMLGAEARGRVMAKVVIGHTAGESTFTVRAAHAVAAFVNALCQLPLHQRETPPQPVIEPAPGDPAGVLRASQEPMPKESDARSGAVFALVSVLAQDAENQAATHVEYARGLAARAVLLHRSLHWGRASHQGMWLSVLHANDIGLLLPYILGQPVNAYTTHQGTSVLQFQPNEATLRAAIAGAERLSAGAMGGHGGIPLPKPQPVQLQLMPFGDYSGFALDTTSKRGKEENWSLRQYIHRMLLRHEPRAFFLRALYGNSMSLHDLIALPPEHVLQTAQSLAPYIPLTELFPELAEVPGADGITPEVRAAMEKIGSMSLDELQARAEAKWAEAHNSGDCEALFDAALGLQHVNLHDEAIAAYRMLLKRFPERAADAQRGLGDSMLQSATLGTAASLADQRALEALECYDAAAAAGEPWDYLENNYFEACRFIATCDQVSPRQKAAVLQGYLARFPAGENRREIEKLLAG